MKGKIFNAQEVQAIIAGNKTMFREVLKTQTKTNEPLNLAYTTPYRTWEWGNSGVYVEEPYEVGQKIFCKEAFALRDKDGKYFQFRPFKAYKADAESDFAQWKLAQHMKQEHSRLTLEITDIKVERLKDISEEDAIKEGVNKLFTEEEMKHVLRVHQIEKNDTYKNYLWHGHIGRTITKKQSDEWEYQCSAYEKAKDSFFSLWNATHKKPEEKFEANPFVWVVDFKINK